MKVRAALVLFCGVASGHEAPSKFARQYAVDAPKTATGVQHDDQTDLEFKKFLQKFETDFNQAVDQGVKAGKLKSKSEAASFEKMLDGFAKEKFGADNEAKKPTKLVAVDSTEAESADANGELAQKIDRYFAAQHGNVKAEPKFDADEAKSAAEQAKVAAEMQKYFASQYAPGNFAPEESGGGPAKSQAEVQADQKKLAEKMGKYYAGIYGPGGFVVGGQASNQASPLNAAAAPGQKDTVPYSATDCHSVEELLKWKAAQLSSLHYVPKAYRSYPEANVESAFEENLERIRREQAAKETTVTSQESPAEESPADKSPEEAPQAEPEAPWTPARASSKAKTAAEKPQPQLLIAAPAKAQAAAQQAQVAAQQAAAQVAAQKAQAAAQQAFPLLNLAVVGAVFASLGAIVHRRWWTVQEDPHSVYLMQP